VEALAKSKMMLAVVATALGEEILKEVAFVGGCTTGLLVTDDFSKQSVRFTDDVDLIVTAIGKAGWYQFQEKMRLLGFTESSEDDVSCRMRLGELKVDFMPDDATVLGFTNRWYKQALESANSIQLNDELAIRIVSPVFFIGTKLEAYKGRGNSDPLSSHDIEDVLTVLDGRDELVQEILSSSTELRKYIQVELQDLLKNSLFEYAVQAATASNSEREKILVNRIQKIVG